MVQKSGEKPVDVVDIPVFFQDFSTIPGGFFRISEPSHQPQLISSPWLLVVPFFFGGGMKNYLPLFIGIIKPAMK